jgi:hypothetical protein
MEDPSPQRLAWRRSQVLLLCGNGSRECVALAPGQQLRLPLASDLEME